MKTIRNLAAVAAVAAGVAAAAGQQQGAAGPEQRAEGAPAPQAPTESQVRAREILMQMARYLSTLPAFSVTAESSYDVVQASGQKIEFGEWRKVVVQRPDRLRADTERSDGARTMAVFTGSEMALLDVTNKVYASTPQPGGLDESILHFVSDLKMRFPMAVLLMSRLPVEFERRVRSIDYVETGYLYGVPAHHLAARGDTVDFQVWVRAGAQPLPVRVVITYRDEPGEPEYRAQFSNWNTRPSITAATFRPQLPPDTRKVAFAAQLMALGTAGHDAQQ
jgi:hypothetical protein